MMGRRERGMEGGRGRGRKRGNEGGKEEEGSLEKRKYKWTAVLLELQFYVHTYVYITQIWQWLYPPGQSQTKASNIWGRC